MTRVLHVAHGLGSGVAAAMLDYVRSTPEYEHHLFCSMDESCAVSDDGRFRSDMRSDGQPVRFVRELRATARRLRPDLVHAHSSIGGAFSRLALSVRATPVVYTPHCFAFERRDISVARRRAFWLAERLLAHRTSVVAACSPREQRLATRLRASAVYVPNIVREVPIRPTSDAIRRPRVVTSGRICAQKDPETFAAIARLMPSTDFIWIGGGDAQLAGLLTAAGVDVTGWLSRDAAVDVIADADAYLHTALWEGAPLTVLEACAVGVPVVGRDTPSLRALGVAALWRTPHEAAAMLEDPSTMAAAKRDGDALILAHTPEAQRSALLRAYADALAGARRGAPARLLR